MATTQDIRKAATDTAFAAVGVADITAEKIGHLVAEAPQPLRAAAQHRPQGPR
ncbi:hypothetical protein GCM10020000_35430 [Streptomyces olivoverticillatus]